VVKDGAVKDHCVGLGRPCFLRVGGGFDIAVWWLQVADRFGSQGCCCGDGVVGAKFEMVVRMWGQSWAGFEFECAKEAVQVRGGQGQGQI